MEDNIDQEMDLQDNNVLCRERHLEDNDVFYEDSHDRVEEKEEYGNTAISGGGQGGARKDTNHNEKEVETKVQDDQALSGQEDGAGLEPGIGLEEPGEREEGEIVEEGKIVEDVHQAENEKVEAEAKAFSIQSKDQEEGAKVSSAEKKTDDKKITGIYVLPDNIYYSLVFEDDERGLYYTDSEGEEEETEAATTQNKDEAAPPPTTTTTSPSVEQPPKAVTEEVHPLSLVGGGETQEENGE